MTDDTIFVLGASDPEMEAIESLLIDHHQLIAYATVDGKRVHPGNAYRTNTTPLRGKAPRSGKIYFVECGSQDETDFLSVHHIDHHRPGDPGFGRPSAEFLSASSIGQVFALLKTVMFVSRVRYANLTDCDHGAVPHTYCYAANKWYYVTDYILGEETDVGGFIAATHYWSIPVPNEIVMVAAADHCLLAAYAGLCPGVDPDALMHHRIKQRAAFQRRSPEAVLHDVDTAKAALLAAPKVTIAGIEVADFGDTTIPELPEAACRLGIPFLATVTERDGRRKQVLQAAPPVLIEVWPHDYGDPQRGFAGRYV